MPTLPILRPRVQRRISAHSADTQLTSDVIDDFVNVAATQVSLEEDWPYLFQTTTFSTAVDTTTYTPPADWRKTHTLTDVLTGDHLELRTIQELDTIVFSGDPRIYTIYEDEINLKPIPNSVRTIRHRYVRKENELTGDNSELLMPDGVGFEEGLIEYAAFLALRFVREDARAEQARKAYELWLDRARNNRLRTREPMRIQVRPDSQV